MPLNDTVALVTGANRGLGRAFAQHLLAEGAKVYAAARRPETVDLPGAQVLRLDITDPAQVAAAAAQASDLTVLINNAGVQTGADALTGAEALLRAELETHLFGTLAVTRAFAPVLAANGGGAILTVHSALSWFPLQGAGGYHIAKAAEWALTNATRVELAGQGTQVTALHLGAADTDMTAGYTGPKLVPAELARLALDGVAVGRAEILADDWSRYIKSTLADDPAEVYPELTRRLTELASTGAPH
ncbi:SDR family oxidoreductase [Nocardia sp. NPDC057227]|uniref:SDR family oxidoreductase n=1 Tax=Nocardia sp. NPDC057227 TaxID=3346056 RepID=UPI00363BC746